MKPATMETRTITAAEFKARCLQLMDEVNSSKLTLVVTKRGKPVAQMSAPEAEAKPFRSILGRTPGVPVLPRQKSKLKRDWTADWEASTRDLAALLEGKPRAGGRR